MATQNPIDPQALMDPNYALRMMQAERNSKIADMLTQQSMQPIDYDHAGAISPLQGLAKMLQGYSGRDLANQSLRQQAAARTQGFQAQMDRYGDTGGQVDPNAGTAQPGLTGSLNPAMPSGMRTPTAQSIAQALVPTANGSLAAKYGMTPLNMALANAGDPTQKAIFDQAVKDSGLSDSQKLNRDYQLTPGNLQSLGRSAVSKAEMDSLTPTGQAQRDIENSMPGSSARTNYDAAMLKATHVIPDKVTPGELALSPGTGSPLAYNPKLDPGINSTFATNGQGFTSPTEAAPIPGYVNANASIAGAEAKSKGFGELGSKVIQYVDPVTQQPSVNIGKNMFGGSGGASPSGNTPQLNQKSGQTTQSVQPTGQPTSPIVKGGIQAGFNPIVQSGQIGQQKDMTDKFKILNDAASNTQSVNNRLDNISDLASKTSTGQFADKLQYINSLLTLAGSEKASDSNTAKVLLDKNSNQIIAQLGQGGLGTDAARSILTSAYPNSHMPAGAIPEAVANLKGASSMTLSKANVLRPFSQKVDPIGYSEAEQKFDNTANPSIFQWHAMPPGPAKNALATQMLARDPGMSSKIDSLENQGAFK